MVVKDVIVDGIICPETLVKDGKDKVVKLVNACGTKFPDLVFNKGTFTVATDEHTFGLKFPPQVKSEGKLIVVNPLAAVMPILFVPTYFNNGAFIVVKFEVDPPFGEKEPLFSSFGTFIVVVNLDAGAKPPEKYNSGRFTVVTGVSVPMLKFPKHTSKTGKLIDAKFGVDDNDEEKASCPVHIFSCGNEIDDMP